VNPNGSAFWFENGTLIKKEYPKGYEYCKDKSTNPKPKQQVSVSKVEDKKESEVSVSRYTYHESYGLSRKEVKEALPFIEQL